LDSGKVYESLQIGIEVQGGYIPKQGEVEQASPANGSTLVDTNVLVCAQSWNDVTLVHGNFRVSYKVSYDLCVDRAVIDADV
jgi:hypothetical protein